MSILSVVWTIISIGVDYLTITAKSPGARIMLQREAELMAGVQIRNGGYEKPWRSQGYDGWKVGSVTFGSRQDSVIMKLSGNVPSDVLMRMSRVDFHCTRIDVQVTAQSDRHWPLYGDAAMRQAEWDRELLKDTPEDRNWAKIKRIDGRGEGDTIQVGSRSSKRFGRLYDKYAQSGEEGYHNAWRWEVEYKEELAPVVLQRVVDGGARADVISGVVAWQYLEWKFNLPWEYRAGDSVDEPQHAKSDAERKMQWIRGQVAPTIKWLIENGHVDSLEALVYTDVV